jgi:hypothetical protein
MKTSHDSNEEKPMPRKAKMKPSANETRPPQRDGKDKERERPTQESPSASPAGRIVADEQYTARVSQKAYELYEKRQGTTDLEDWLEAERLVKMELLAEGQWAGSV